ncbi:MAG TPA: Hint domain-containing protein [Candidatus Limnocylindria bacterium]|nr:Hint domain-containing protein [Candidatus Limnocylindria bacterium]
MGARALLCLALAAVVACGGTAAASPTPAPSPLPQAELKYRVMDAGGRIEFCDPDFYPIARADEGQLAKAKSAEIRQDVETYAAITRRVGTDELAVYREWKALRALVLTPSTGGAIVTDGFAFDYRASAAARGSTPAPKTNGTRVEGRVDLFGKVDISRRTDAGPLNCPICLARGTRIATPAGEVAVEDLRVGDVVWTLDAHGERFAAPLVAIGSAPVPPTHEVVRLALADGRIVTVSPGHPTADGRRVGDLHAGDVLDGSLVVSAVRVGYAAGFTFDVLPAGATGAYWADGVLLGSTLR